MISQSKKCLELSGKFQMSLVRLTTTSANKNFERSPYKVLQSRKAQLIRQNLKRRHFQLLFIVQHMMHSMLAECPHTETVIDCALMSCDLLNESVATVSGRNIHRSGGAQFCSNTFPALMSLPRRLEVGVILQVKSELQRLSDAGI